MSHRIVALLCAVGEDRVHGLLERAIGAANGPARQWLQAGYFPSAASRLYIARQNSRPSAILHFVPAASASLPAVQVRPVRRLSSP